MRTSATFLKTVPGQRVCAIASTRFRWRSRKTSANQCWEVSLRGRAGVRNHLSYRINFTLPGGQQQHLVSCGIPENIIHVGNAIELKEAGPARVRTPGQPRFEQQPKLRDLLLRVRAKVLDQRRFLI